ncbi:MAG: sodium:proton antiporter [Syntrophorhabdaceae bacterium]|nr:sodium:proton antiporter [Syntrophorhabdaceae bacterium]
MFAQDPLVLGLTLPFWSVLPFVGLLLAIALFPVFAPAFWLRHYGRVSLAFGLPTAAYFAVRAPGELLHLSMEYVSFVVLLGALFIVSGGILFRGAMRGSPAVNSVFLAGGAVLANLLGTTGASMLLIRPLLRANAGRKRSAHVVVFFIFVVANIGGLLTAIGDPPLFLGYLKGVPFFWTLVHMKWMWFFVVTTVISVFYMVDRRVFMIEQRAREAATADEAKGVRHAASVFTAPCVFSDAAPSLPEEKVSVSVKGKINFLLLAAVVGSVFLSSPWREILMAAAAAASIWLTPAAIRKENGFTYHPINEVAILFAGIFATILPAMLILKARGVGLGITNPAHFFWATGLLSSFLDNAPTYLVFLSLAQSLGDVSQVAGVSAPLLKAISAGAVFMGANTYIGNAPNFMVKAIAEETGVRMPSFFGYMGWSCVVLLPVFILVTLIFF